MTGQGLRASIRKSQQAVLFVSILQAEKQGLVYFSANILHLLQNLFFFSNVKSFQALFELLLDILWQRKRRAIFARSTPAYSILD